jgi:hypothetical protein
MTGFGYGLLFGCSPVIGNFPFSVLSANLIASELFGMEYVPGTSVESDVRAFSQNWGWITLTPAISGTAFNFSFGKLLLRERFLIAQAVYSMHMRKACLTDVTKVKLAMPPRFC